MYRGYRRFVSLALSVCYILSMLFLDTYEVNASTNQDYTVSGLTWNGRFATSVDTSTSTSGYISAGRISDGTGSTSSGTISSTSSSWQNGLIYHVKLPFTITGSYSGNDYDDTVYAKVLTMFANFSCNNGTISNAMIYNSDGEFIGIPNDGSAYTSVFTKPANELYMFIDGYNYGYRANYWIECDIAFDSKAHVGISGSYYDTVFTLGYVRNYVQWTNNRTTDSIKVFDSQSNAKLDDIKSASQSTANTTNSIFSSITSFFSSFFENIINSFKSLFIPEDGYFTEWFNRLNTLLADKLGMLYAPFDLVISTLTAIMNADSSETGIPFPGIKWEDTWLVEPFTFTFSSLGNDMSDLRDTVYFATDVVLLFAFLYLLEEKIRHILED